MEADKPAYSEMTSENLYDILSVSRTASTKEIRDAYRKQTSKHHPDRNKGSDESTERTKQIRHAFDVLSDEFTRKLYDQDSETEFDDHFIEAVKRLTGQLIAIVSNEENVESVNLHALMIMNIHGWMNAMNQTINDIEGQKNKFKKIQDKFIKRHKGYNIFSEAIRMKVENFDANIAEVKDTISIAEKMLEILKGYDYQQLLSFYSSNTATYQ